MFSAATPPGSPLLIAVYYGLGQACASRPGALISLSGVAAILAGVVLNRPARKAPWLLLAAALASFAAGQLSFLIAARCGWSLPFPSFADVLYLSDLPAVRGRAADLHLLAHPGRRPAQPDRRADAHGRPRPAVVDLPDPPYVHNPDAVRAAEVRRDRLPARRRADARPAGPAARAGVGADQVRPAPHPRRGRRAWLSDTALRRRSSCTGRSTTGPSSTSAGPCSTPRGAPPRCTRRMTRADRAGDHGSR